LLAAAHRHIDASPSADDGDVADAVKTAAAKMRVLYDGRSVTRIVDAVRATRARRSA
jgi:hypothetical protein